MSPVHRHARRWQRLAGPVTVVQHGALAPDGPAFPWVTLVINVLGCFALALLPALPAVRDRALLALALGPGLLGGFTTLSAYAEEGRALVADGHPGLAAAYVVGTLGACLLAVAAASALRARAEA